MLSQFEKSFLILGAITVACLGGIGCSQKDSGLRAAYGTVSFDGKPLTKGTISFESVTLTSDTTSAGRGSSSGGLVESGKYSVPAEKGLKPGKYRVRISAPDPDHLVKAKNPRKRDMGPMPSGTEIPSELIPVKYNAKSEEIVEIKTAGGNKFDFNLAKE